MAFEVFPPSLGRQGSDWSSAAFLVRFCDVEPFWRVSCVDREHCMALPIFLSQGHRYQVLPDDNREVSQVCFRWSTRFAKFHLRDLPRSLSKSGIIAGGFSCKLKSRTRTSTGGIRASFDTRQQTRPKLQPSAQLTFAWLTSPPEHFVPTSPSSSPSPVPRHRDSSAAAQAPGRDGGGPFCFPRGIDAVHLHRRTAIPFVSINSRSICLGFAASLRVMRKARASWPLEMYCQRSPDTRTKVMSGRSGVPSFHSP